MNKEQIDAIMKELGLSFNKKKVILDGETVTENAANKLLKSKGTSLEEVKKVLAEASKKIIDIPNDLRFKDQLSNIEIISPAFTTDVKWNKKDEELFKFFSLARSSEGGGMLLLIHNLDTEYRTVMISNSSLQNLAEITSACSKMTYTNPVTHTKITLHDHIMKVYKEIMNEALVNYKKMDVLDFGNWAVKFGLPSMMINNYKLMSIQEERTIENDEGHKQTMYRAFSLYFNESPFQCIANHYDTLAGVPSRLAKIPKLYSNDYDEPALYHIDLEKILDTENPHPTWDKYLRRFTEDEVKVIEAFVWSIFKADNTGRQMLYFYDPDGFSGKSVFEKAIASGLGEGLVAALQKDSLNNQFSMSKIWNKRLVVIDDNKNPNLVRSEKMHMVLGSGLADVEGKGKNSFMYKLQCKVIASGNCRLNIDPSANHERTRVIVVEPKLTDDMLKEFAVCDEYGNVIRNRFGRVQLIGDATFEQNLIKEFGSFLVECKSAYEKLCPKNSSIILAPSMEEAIESLSDDVFDIIDDIIEDKFEFYHEAHMSVLDFNSVVEKEILFELSDNFNKKTLESITRDNVIQHIVKKYKVTKKPIRTEDGTVRKCYVGLNYKNASSKKDNAKIVSVNVAKQSEGSFFDAC